MNWIIGSPCQWNCWTPDFGFLGLDFGLRSPGFRDASSKQYFGFLWPGIRIVLHWGFNAMLANCIYMFKISVKKCPSCSSMTSLEDCNGKIKLKTCRSFFSDRFACAVIQYKQDFYSRTCISDFTKVRAEKFGICMEDQCLANLTFTAGKLILVIAFSLLSNGIFLLTHTQRDMVHGCLLDDFIQICHGILPTLSFVVAFYKDAQESSAHKA